MRVLVTGGCGFIGSALVRSLLARGDQVINIDKLAAAANTSLAHYPAPDYTLKPWDLAQPEVPLLALLVEFQPEIIYHLAAETHVDNSIAAPMNSVHANVMSTLHLLEAVRQWRDRGQSNLHQMVLVSTDEVYGDSADYAADHESFETDRLVPSSPYSASKAAADQLGLAWYRTFGVPVLISRCCNNYGPWQYPEKLIPKFIQRALAGQSLPLYGDGLQQREWLYVDDHVQALMLLAERGRSGEIYNVGSQQLNTNVALTLALCDLLDALRPGPKSYREKIEWVADRPGHDRCYRINSEKIHQLGWRASTAFDVGLRYTVQWHLTVSGVHDAG